MKHNTYSLVTSEYKGIRVYGIKIETESGVTYLYTYISVFADEVSQLIRQMSKDYISPVHFNDIVTDYLVRLHENKLQVNNLSKR